MSCTYKVNGVICGNKTNENRRTGKPYPYCLKCNGLSRKAKGESFSQAVANHIRKTQCCWIGNYPKTHFRVKCIEPKSKGDFCKIHESDESSESDDCVPLPTFGISKNAKNMKKSQKMNVDQREQISKILKDPVSSDSSDESNVAIPEMRKITIDDLGSNSDEETDSESSEKPKKDKKQEKADKKATKAAKKAKKDKKGKKSKK